MIWKITLIIILLRYAYQFYRSSKNPSIPFPPQFQELIKIIDETTTTWIHYPGQISQFQYGFLFDVRLITGKAKGKAHLDFEHSVLTINISNQIPVPEKYHEFCFEFIGIVNSIYDNMKLELDHRTRIIAINSWILFEPSIGVLSPDTDHLLNAMIGSMNQYLKAIQKITLGGMSAEEAVSYCKDIITKKPSLH